MTSTPRRWTQNAKRRTPQGQLAAAAVRRRQRVGHEPERGADHDDRRRIARLERLLPDPQRGPSQGAGESQTPPLTPAASLWVD